MWPFETKSQALIRNHVGTRDALIEEASKVDRHEDVQEAVLASDIVGLVEGIKTGRWTATIVVRVFVHAAIRAHRQTNCLTEVNFEYALQRASELDDAFSKTGELVGPLHGVPFSLKDQYNLRGKHTTIGYSEWIKRGPLDADCALSQISEHLGAIPLCKTNVPQTMLSFECRNPVWDRTLNPYNDKHSSGGSSGGEAALLASDGAAFGFGSDIGGSLRIPTHYCGIYALKPSSGRSFPFGGTSELAEGANTIPLSLGPMTRNAADLQLLTTLFYSTLYPPADSALTVREIQRRFGAESRVESPLRPAWFDPIQAVTSRSPLRQKIRVGYYYCDGVSKTSPACIRAVEMAKGALEGVKGKGGNAAVEMVEIEPKLLQAAYAFRIFIAVSSASGYWYLRKHLGPDRKDPSLYLVLLPAMSRVLKGLITFIVRYILRDRLMTTIVKLVGPKDTNTFFSWMYKMELLNRQFDKNVWEGLDLDGIVCPVQAIPAIPHGGSTKLSSLASCTILYNVIDSAVTVLPITTVDPELDSVSPQSAHFKKWNATKGFETTSSMMTTATYQLYDSEKWKGLPVGVQIVTPGGQEELSIGLMRLVDDALGPRGFGPRSLK